MLREFYGSNTSQPLLADGKERCPECGAIVIGGRGGCQLLFEGFGYQASSHPKIAAVHWLIVDTYCTWLQAAIDYKLKR